MHVGESSLFLHWLQLHPTHRALPHLAGGGGAGKPGDQLGSRRCRVGSHVTWPSTEGQSDFLFRKKRRHVLRGEEGREHPELGGECGGGGGAEPHPDRMWGDFLSLWMAELCLPNTDSGWTQGEVTGTPPWLSDSRLPPPHAPGPGSPDTHLLCEDNAGRLSVNMMSLCTLMRRTVIFCCHDNRLFSAIRSLDHFSYITHCHPERHWSGKAGRRVLCRAPGLCVGVTGQGGGQPGCL